MARKLIRAAGRAAGPKGSWRRRWTVLLALVLAVGAAMLMKQTVFAVHTEDLELDADVAPDVADVAPFDWTDLFVAKPIIGADPVDPLPDPPGTNEFTHAGFSEDFQTRLVKGNVAFANADNTTYATGSKDTLPITPGWQCTRSNNVTDKDDIMNAYAVSYVAANGDKILYFAMERNANEGTANIGFWFLQGEGIGCESPGGAVAFSGHHVDGDLFIVSQFSNGGVVSTINVYEWQGDDTGFLDPVPIASGTDCRLISDPDDAACGVANQEDITGIPWFTSNKDDDYGHTLRVSEFFEGGLNLTKSNITDRCFNTFVGNTRSSTSLTATIFDYAMGTLGQCAATLETDVRLANADLAANAIIAPGVAVHDVATVTITGADEPDDATGSVDFFYCFNASAIPNCATGGTAAGADIPLVDTSSPANTTDGISGANSTEINGGTPLAAGFYCFRAEFTFTNYDQPDPNTHTNSTTECFQVQDTSTVTTAQRWLPNDEATVVLTSGNAPSGTVTFNLFENGTCAGSPAATFTDVPLVSGKAITNNIEYYTSSQTVSWRVTFNPTNSTAVVGDTSNCEISSVSIDNAGIP